MVPGHVGDPCMTHWLRHCSLVYCCFIRCLHDPANVEQTSSSIITYGSKLPANFQQTSSITFAGSLLDVCWIV